MAHRSFAALVVVACACAAGPACGWRSPEIPADATELRSDVYVQPLAEGVWRHVSFRSYPKGPVPSNGLIVRLPVGALVIDTAWTPEQTAPILDWATGHVGPVRGVVVTHAHDDRLGGLEEVQRRGIRSYALAETSRLAAEAGWPAIGEPVESGFSLEAFGIDGEIYFPGAGHTVDNAVVWFAGPRILVGGCMVRAASATSLGYTAAADLESWPLAIASLRERYPSAAIVVPGHGEPGGIALLVHTAELLAQAPS